MFTSDLNYVWHWVLFEVTFVVVILKLRCITKLVSAVGAGTSKQLCNSQTPIRCRVLIRPNVVVVVEDGTVCSHNTRWPLEDSPLALLWSRTPPACSPGAGGPLLLALCYWKPPGSRSGSQLGPRSHSSDQKLCGCSIKQPQSFQGALWPRWKVSVGHSDGWTWRFKENENLVLSLDSIKLCDYTIYFLLNWKEKTKTISFRVNLRDQ